MMNYNPQIYHRRSIRLKGYDYAQAGLYFITLCCHNREHLFGKIINGNMILNDAGNIANGCWLKIPKHFPNVILHEHIIMPNHVHGIIELVGANHHSPDNNALQNILDGNVANHHLPNNIETENILNGNGVVFNNGAKNVSPLPVSPSKTIGSVIRGYKIGVTKWMRINTNVYDVWQRNYHENIIRNEQSYETISNYIINNPQKWEKDKFYKLQ